MGLCHEMVIDTCLKVSIEVTTWQEQGVGCSGLDVIDTDVRCADKRVSFIKASFDHNIAAA